MMRITERAFRRTSALFFFSLTPFQKDGALGFQLIARKKWRLHRQDQMPRHVTPSLLDPGAVDHGGRCQCFALVPRVLAKRLRASQEAGRVTGQSGLHMRSASLQLFLAPIGSFNVQFRVCRTSDKHGVCLFPLFEPSNSCRLCRFLICFSLESFLPFSPRVGPFPSKQSQRRFSLLPFSFSS